MVWYCGHSIVGAYLWLWWVYKVSNQAKYLVGDARECLFLRKLFFLGDEMPSPSVEILKCLLHQFRKENSSARASGLQSYTHKIGLHFHKLIESTFISILVEDGSMSKISDVMLFEKEGLLNSLITGYAKCGELKHAFFFYEKVKDAVRLCPQTVVALLKACAEHQDVERGREMHIDVSRQELDTDLLVGSTLVNLYAKCGLLEQAQEVFDRLLARDVVSWNALIAGYAKQGCGEEALKCLELMQGQGIVPNTVTFVCSLKACGSLGASGKGQELHAEIARKGMFQEHHFVGNALVDMYAKCGLLAQAQEVFDGLFVRDSIAWNSLVAGFASYGHLEPALNCLKLMKLDGASTNTTTFLPILKACSTLGAIDTGREIHAETARTGLSEKDPIVGKALVDMYASSGQLEQAQDVLQELCLQDVVAWTSLISHYINYERCEEALECFMEMQQRGVSPNSITYICSLKACSILRAIDKGQEIHDEIASLGLLERNLAISNALLDMYANCGFLGKLQEVFDKLPHRDVVSWTALMTGYTNHEHGKEALNYFERMQLEGISPDAITFACALKACGCIGAAERGVKIHDTISKEGLLERDLVVGNALIDMYASCGLLAEAQKVLDELPVLDVVSWTALIAGYVKHGYDVEALNCMDQMQRNGIFLDDFTLVYALQACGNVGALGKGRELHSGVLNPRLPECDLLIGNALIDMYAKCGLLGHAREIFNVLPNKDEISWNALIAGYAQLGEIDSVLFYFNGMVTENKKPNSVTLVGVLTACSHAGLVDKTEMLFEIISERHCIIPTLEHLTCMIDLLGRAGQVCKMAARIEKMPFHPSLVVWHSLMGAYRNWGDVNLGRQAFANALQVDENDAGSFVCMSNIYAGSRMQEFTEKWFSETKVLSFH